MDGRVNTTLIIALILSTKSTIESTFIESIPSNEKTILLEHTTHMVSGRQLRTP